MKRIAFIATLCFIASLSLALITDYYGPPTASAGTYTAISGTPSGAFDGNVTDEELTLALPLGFSFSYCGTTYTQFKMSTNGYLAMGAAHSWFYSYDNYLNSTISTYFPFIAPLWDDLTCANMSYLTTGTAPNRVFTAQWANATWDWGGTETQNFQVKLYETSNKIEFVYGPMTTPTNPSATIGINTAPGGPGNFYSITPGATLSYSTTVENDNVNSITYLSPGTTFTFMQAAASIPAPAVAVSPLNGATSVLISSNLMWTSGGGLPTSYKLNFGTNGGGITSPSSIANNVNLGNNTSYDPILDLESNTLYYWQIIPSNTAGTTPNCPIWSFTTSGQPLRGEKTIDPLGSGPDNFTSFTAAINALNSVGVGQDGVIFNVPAGRVINEAAAVPAITVSGTLENPITFMKSGAGANPVVTIPGTGGSTDYVFKLVGADYLTFDGIDIRNPAGQTAIEYGYWLVGTPAFGGSSNNVIKNSMITLSQANSNSFGVYSISTTTTNDNNLFQNLTINSAQNGIYLEGSPSMHDVNSVIQGCTFNNINEYNMRLDYQTDMEIFDNLVNFPTSNDYLASTLNGLNCYELYNSPIHNNTFSGGNTNKQIKGIFVHMSGDIEVHHNTISGIVSTNPWFEGIGVGMPQFGTANIHHNDIYDIQAGMIAFVIDTSRGYNININDNNIHDISVSMAFWGIHCIENVSLDAPANIFNNKVYGINITGDTIQMVAGINVQDKFANVYNNMVWDIKAPNTTYNTYGGPQVAGISMLDMQPSQGERGYVYNNTVILDATGTANSSTACFYTTFPGPVDLKNNIFINHSTPGIDGKAAAFWKSTPSFDNYLATMDKNIYYAGTPDARHLIYVDNLNNCQTLAEYKALNVGKDQNSYTEDVPFVSAVAPYDLHINPTVATRVEGNGIYLPFVLIDDIDGDIRSTNPDIGADEGDFTAYTGVTVTSPVNVQITKSGMNVQISWDAVAGAIGYYVYGSDLPYATTPWGTPLDTVTAPGTSTMLSPSAQHKFYYVTAY